ncbi:MAG: sporulation protein YunB [Bacilli bacterium]|nr:sporulation protein YunB [Bacilli bacterium]
MGKRIRLKKTKYKKSIKQLILGKILVILTLVVIISFFIINLFSNKATPILLNHAELETKRLATVIINRAISKQIANEIDLEELIITTKNNDGEIQTIDFNPYLVNKVLNSITNSVQLNLKWLQEGKVDMIELPEGVIVNYDNAKLKQGIIYEMPMGLITKNAFLSNLGPKIPVKLNLVGAVECGVNTKVNDYGINNAVVEISVNVKVSEQVSLPFTSKLVEIETDIPVAIKIIEGKVPSYYSNGISKNSDTFSIPIN